MRVVRNKRHDLQWISMRILTLKQDPQSTKVCTPYEYGVSYARSPTGSADRGKLRPFSDRKCG
jgi:hypothetical protein